MFVPHVVDHDGPFRDKVAFVRVVLRDRVREARRRDGAPPTQRQRRRKHKDKCKRSAISNRT